MSESRPARYILVSINDDGEREIIFVSNDLDEITRWFGAFTGNGAIYAELQE